MSELIQQLIPAAMGIIISPLPIAAIIAIVLSPRAKINGAAFAAGSVLVTFVITVVTALTTTGVGSKGGSGNDIIVLVLGIVLSLAFLVLAVVSWRSRPPAGTEAKAPGWLSAIDSMSAAKTFGLGLVMGITNGKNLPLEIKSGAHIGAAHLDAGAVIGISALFAIAGGLAVILATVLAAIGTPAITAGLGRMKTELIAHNAVIMTAVFAMLFAIQLANVVHLLLK
ncbi:hypothetical protein BH09ACT6_BH09ACT6_03300 [soil metagenome]